MKIDNFICNPPYNNPKTKDKKLSRICNNIISSIKEMKPSNFIAICPINASLKYRIAEFIDKPFEIRWNNVFIFDLLGNENEYYTNIQCPLYDSSSNKVLWLKWGKHNKIVLAETSSKCSKRNISKIEDIQETNDFIAWCNENKLWEIDHIPTTAATKGFFNKLWYDYVHR